MFSALVIATLWSVVVGQSLPVTTNPTNIWTDEMVTVNCTSDESCREVASLLNESPLYCVESVCRCEPNHNMIINVNETTSLMEIVCEKFECENNEDCQKNDPYRECEVKTGRCLCHDDYRENLQKKCVEYKIPTYKVVERKYLNKNRISYRENMEQWHPENDNRMMTYILIAALIVSKVGLGVYYVMRKKKRNAKKLSQKRNSEGVSDSVPPVVNNNVV